MVVGVINATIGPMFAGKTTKLLADAKKMRQSKKRVYLVCPNIVCGREGLYYSHLDVKVECHCDFPSNLDDFDVYLIDEVQFIKDAWKMCQRLAKMGKIVECYGLDMDYRGNPFDETGKILCIADNITKLRGYCHKCCDNSTMTEKLDKENKNIVDVGSDDKYIPVCKNCHKF